MSRATEVTVQQDEDGMRLDRWIKSHAPGVTHGRLQKLLRTGQIRVGGGRAKANQRVEAGDLVRLPPELSEGGGAPAGKDERKITTPSSADPQLVRDIQGRVLYRDADILIIDKPAGLAVQGGSGLARHLDGVLDSLKFDAAERPRLVHRLDKDTSGVLALARNRKAAQRLTRQFKDKSVEKLYWAAVAGVPNQPEGSVSLGLEKKRVGEVAEKMAAGGAAAQPAFTRYRIVETFGRRAAWLVMLPETGRTHQLRVHAARGLDCPILGDGKYGGKAAFPEGIDGIKRLHLHARRLIIRGADGKTIDVTAPLPAHMARTWGVFGFEQHAGADDIE